MANQANDLPPEFARMTGMLVADVDRLCRLTEDLLEISRLDSGQEPPEAEPVDAAVLVQGVLQSHGCSDSVDWTESRWYSRPTRGDWSESSRT